ncbi:sensor histidine kinase [Streptomyces canus]|uniref:sensor histidine kinase n=1 Tax=Streptomyces canus TaxID=58343 RepID=UPI00074AF8AD|nr:sensor histidine kinase [Streptomyces canus]KUN10861.1 hypothetical protein AQI96_22170 [Streptomyces canus]
MTDPQEQAGAPSVARDLVTRWADRWRYPELLALLSRTDHGTELGPDALADAIADGLACPVDAPEHAARMLVERGEFAAAREMPGWTETEAVTEAAVAEAKARLGRRLDRLTRRAVRAGLTDRPPEGLESLVEIRSIDADTDLDRWEEHLRKAEKRRVADLEDRLTAALEEDGWAEAGSDTPESARANWEQSVRNCLAQGELAAAERLLDAGPSPDAVGGPLTVPGQRTWPWADVPLRDALTWYSGSVSTRPEFAGQWRPDDESGTALIKALADLYRNVSAENVRNFANALDTHLGADAARHQVEECGGGFVTWLSGVADYQRIPQLALPRKLRLYVCPDGREPEVPEKDRPAAWLVLRMQAATQRELSPPGVAVLDARTVLQLAAPDRRGVATSRSHRTVNLLRAMGRGLRVVDVVGRQPLPDDRSGPAAHPHEEHEDLAWWLDLLGVRYTDAVVDMLLYDTDGHPVALRAALAGLLPDTDRPFELTSEALQEWRASPEAQASFHDAVVDRSFLGSDREAAAALRAVLLLIHGEPELTLSAEDIASHLGSSAHDAGSPPLELEAALSRVAAAGFLRQEPGDRGYRWNGPGLAALLVGPDPRRVESRLGQDVQELYDRRDRSEESAVLVGLLEVRESYTHTAVNRATGATDAIRRMLEHEDLSEQARFEAQGALRALEEGQQAEARARDPQRLYGDLRTKEPLDLRAELQSHCLGLLTEAPASVDVDFVPDTDQEVVVWASHQLLKMAVGNLLDNALREIGPKGRIRVTLGLLPRGREGVGGPVARIDIEDSGPGVPENWLPFLNGTVSGPPPAVPKGSGRGVTFARNFIVAHNGTLVFLARSRDLRGAHVRIELPVTETPPQR